MATQDEIAAADKRMTAWAESDDFRPHPDARLYVRGVGDPPPRPRQPPGIPPGEPGQRS